MKKQFDLSFKKYSKMKKIIGSALLLLACIYLQAQTLTVVDKTTNLPIEMVAVQSQKPWVEKFTNQDGQVDLKAFTGAENVAVYLFGYQKQVVNIATMISAGQNATVFLEPSRFTLDQVVVSASRRNENKRDVPAHIATISSREMYLQNPQTTADLLTTSGEVFMQKSQQGGGSPMIRGFATNRLVYTVDGVRMNTAIFRSGNLQNVISLDPFAIENTEVFFGPGSVIYGSDAIGGVMSFATLRPQLSLTDEVKTAGGALLRMSTANNERTGNFHISLGTKKWGFLTSVSSQNYGNLKMGSYGPEEYLRPFYVQTIDTVDRVVANNDSRIQNPSAFTQLNFMQKITYKHSERLRFDYGFHYSETSPYARYDRHIRYKGNGSPRYGEWNYGPQKWMMNNLNISWIASNKVFDDLSIRLAQQRFEESRIDRGFNKSTRTTNTEMVDAYSINIDFNKALSQKGKLIYGFEGVINDVNSTGTTLNIKTGETGLAPARYPISTWSSYAAYASYQHKFTEKFLLQAGARFNSYSLESDFSQNLEFYPLPYTTANINNAATTGSLGLVYSPTATFTIHGNVSTAFRAPNVDDIGKLFESGDGYVVVPNPDLKAEYAYNGEIGVSKIFGNWLEFDITAFYTRLNDAMVRRNSTLNGQDSIMYNGELCQVQSLQNAAFANVYGVQFGVEINFSPGLSLHSQLNYQHGEEELDNGETSRSRHAAPTFGITRLRYSFGKATLEFNAQYSAEVSNADLNVEERTKPEIYASDANGKPYSPSWYTLNFKGQYQLTPLVSISGGMENITDQRYRPYSSGIAAPGRNFVLALHANF